jgi:hypothetical protein
VEASGEKTRRTRKNISPSTLLKLTVGLTPLSISDLPADKQSEAKPQQLNPTLFFRLRPTRPFSAHDTRVDRTQRRLVLVVTRSFAGDGERSPTNPSTTPSTDPDDVSYHRQRRAPVKSRPAGRCRRMKVRLSWRRICTTRGFFFFFWDDEVEEGFPCKRCEWPVISSPVRPVLLPRSMCHTHAHATAATPRQNALVLLGKSCPRHPCVCSIALWHGWTDGHASIQIVNLRDLVDSLPLA